MAESKLLKYIPSVSWLTLFYDLIVVAVVARATYIYGNDPSWINFAFIGITLTIIYVLWSITSMELLTNPLETWTQRIIILAQVSALLVSGLAMYRGGGLSDRWGFLSLAGSFITVAALAYVRKFNPAADQRFRKPLITISLVAALIYGIGACFPMGFTIGDWFLIAWIFYPVGTLWAIIALAVYGPRLIVPPTTISAHRLNERFGVLLMIVLGDAFLQSLDVLGKDRSIPSPVFLALVLLFVVAVWLLYYPLLSDPPLAATSRAARARITAHFFIITSTAVGIVAYVRLASYYEDVANLVAHVNVWTALPLVAISAGMLWLQLLQDRRWTSSSTSHAIAIVLLCGLTISGYVMSDLIREIDLAAGCLILLASALFNLWAAGKLRRATVSTALTYP